MGLEILSSLAKQGIRPPVVFFFFFSEIIAKKWQRGYIMAERIIIPYIRRSHKTWVERFSIAKPVLCEEQTDIFRGRMAFAEASWNHSTGLWPWCLKAVAVLGQSVCKHPYSKLKLMPFWFIKEVTDPLLSCLWIVVFPKVQKFSFQMGKRRIQYMTLQ